MQTCSCPSVCSMIFVRTNIETVIALIGYRQLGTIKEKERVNIMSETYLDLPSRLEDAFPEIDNDIIMELRNENEEYSELLQKISDLKQQAPFLRDLLDGSGEIRLTAEEHAVFKQYLHLVRQRDDMERQQIYFRGHTDAVAYLRKIKAI